MHVPAVYASVAMVRVMTISSRMRPLSPVDMRWQLIPRVKRQLPIAPFMPSPPAPVAPRSPPDEVLEDVGLGDARACSAAWADGVSGGG